MRLKKIMKQFGICSLLLVVLFFYTGCTNKNDDQYKFKEEYESLNNKDSGYKNYKYKKVSIEKNNNIEYLTSNELIYKIDNQETFIVYFGYNECPWCRSIVENLLKVAKDNKIKKIYYLDIKDLRDEKTLDKDKNIVINKKGTEDYYDILDRLDNVLDDYKIDDVYMKEKRIYAPNIVAIVNGEPQQKTEGIPENYKNPYIEMTKKQKKESYNLIKCAIKCTLENDDVCTKNSC